MGLWTPRIDPKGPPNPLNGPKWAKIGQNGPSNPQNCPENTWSDDARNGWTDRRTDGWTNILYPYSGRTWELAILYVSWWVIDYNATVMLQHTDSYPTQHHWFIIQSFAASDCLIITFYSSYVHDSKGYHSFQVISLTVWCRRTLQQYCNVYYTGNPCIYHMLVLVSVDQCLSFAS